MPQHEKWPEAAYPDHRGLDIASGARIKTKAGEFTIVVFHLGRGAFGQEYEIEWHTPDGGVGTSTKKLDSVREAIKYGRRSIEEEIERVEKGKSVV